MTDLGKFLITSGLVLILAGAVVWALGRFGFRGLPGDIRYEGENENRTLTFQNHPF